MNRDAIARNPIAVVPGMDPVQAAVEHMLAHTIPNHDREGLQDTPARVARAWREHTAGYHLDPGTLLRTFEDGAVGYDGLVLVKDILFHSRCEHHLEPFFGTAAVGYLPKFRVVGLSKLARVVDAYARRLQVQERLTVQVAATIQNELQPLGVGVVIRAQHFCMECRGVRKPGAATVTSKFTGRLFDDATARAEFLQLLGT